MFKFGHLTLVALLAFSVFRAFGNEAPGAPGTLGTWQRPDKSAYGTTVSRPVWFSVAENVVSEIAYPSVDLIQTRDTFLVLRINGKVIDERGFRSRTTRAAGTLAYRVDSEGSGIKIRKEISSVVEADAVVVDYTVDLPSDNTAELILIHNPLVAGTPGGDLMEVVTTDDRKLALFARQGDIRGDEPRAMHVDAMHLVSWSLSTQFGTVGYEGTSSPEDLLAKNIWPQIYTKAGNGNVSGALSTVVNQRQISFRVVLQFFDSKASVKKIAQNQKYLLAKNITDIVYETKAEWSKYLSRLNFDNRDERVESSILVLKALEDKTEPGAFIAGVGNPNLPWSVYASEIDYDKSRRRIGDSNFGYRRVWPRDLYHKAMAFLSVGDAGTALQVARWYRKTQLPEGWWAQNMFVDGTPSWQGYQQDETGFPVVLVTHLVERGNAEYVEFRNMVRQALGLLISRGPGTGQERWEENGGLSPNSLAVAVQALWGGAWLEKNWGNIGLGEKYAATAESWTRNFKKWALIPRGHFGSRYFARLEVGGKGDWDPTDHVDIEIKNKNSKQKNWFKEDEILDLGFVQWIIAGLLPKDDPDLGHTLELCDRFITTDTSYGRGFLRYTEDAYGESNKGGIWPLLSGERLLAGVERGEDIRPHLNLIENMFTDSGMLGEQDTLAIRPLGWSHANYLIVRRSIEDRRSFYKFKKAFRIVND